MSACVQCGHENPVEQKFCGECGARLVAAAVAQERKTVSALFCDLVGSTALGERLDPEVMAALLEEYQQICRRVVESHGGVVQKFIGDAVVAVFGVPAAHEDDPERAVRTGLRLVDEIAASELAVEIRVGIDTGEVLVRLDVDPGAGLGFVTGDAMNTAARLQTAAPPMGVVVGQTTQVAAGSAVVFEALPAVVAKGKSEPVPAWLAVRPVARVGTPERDRTPFVGRELELGMLTQLFERSRARSSVEFVTLVGEAGLGKSRLVRELARYVDELADLVVWREGRCLPFGEGVTFWALGEVVRAQAGIFDTDDQPTIRDKLDAAVLEPDASLRGWMVDRLAPLVGLSTSTQPPQQEEVFAAWRRFLEQLAGTGPVVVVIEDLHWADPGFVAFLTDLSERLAEVSLLVVVTARPEVEERHPSWPPGRRSTVLSLSPLTDDEVQALVADALGGAPEDVVGAVLQRAGGSPLFAEQLAKLAVEEGLTVAGGALDVGQVPATVQALIAARIDGLPADAKAVLLQASVVGRTFWEQTVTTFGAQLDVVGALAELARRELVRPVVSSTMTGQAEYAFWHALVRDVAYGQMTRAERGRLHAATAQWIADTLGESLGESAEVVVHHLDTATEYGIDLNPDRDQLLTSALQHAATTAMRTDLSSALPLLDRALSRLAPDDPHCGELLLSRARAHFARGELDAARVGLDRLIDSLLEEGMEDAAVRAMSTQLKVLDFEGNFVRARALLDRVKLRLGDSPSVALAHLLAAEASMRTNFGNTYGNTPGLVEDLVDQSLKMTHRLGVDASPVALAEQGVALIAHGDRSGEALVQSAIDSLVVEGDVLGVIDVYYSWAVVLSNDDLQASVERIEETVTLAYAYGSVADVGSLRAARLMVLTDLGRLDEVVAEAEHVLTQVRQTQDSLAELETLGANAHVGLLRGIGGVDTDRLCERGRELGHGGTLLLVATVLSAQGDAEAAKRLAREAMQVREVGRYTQCAVWLTELGFIDQAEDVLHTERSRQRGAVDEATYEYALGITKEHRNLWDEAVVHFDTAATMSAGLSYLPRQAEATEGSGRCLLRLGKAEEGRERLGEARRLWEGMKATRCIALIDALLARENAR